MNVTSADWILMKRYIPPKLALVCDYAAKVQANINHIEYSLRIGGLKQNKIMYPGLVIDVLEDSRALTLEFISIIRQYFPQPARDEKGAPSEKPMIDGLITDLKEIFKVTDSERGHLRGSFDQGNGGQILLTIQKVKELMHAYIYRTLQQAKGEPSSFDKQIMDLFIQSSVGKLPLVESTQINWKKERREMPNELYKLCTIADELQYKINIKRDYSYVGFELEILELASSLGDEYLRVIKKHNPEYVQVVTKILQNIFSIENTRHLASSLMYHQVYATILASQNKYESKFLQAVIVAAQERRGIAPPMEKDKGIFKLDKDKD